jgi:cobalt-zinc-cadmium efflux system outer membrane protein
LGKSAFARGALLLLPVIVFSAEAVRADVRPLSLPLAIEYSLQNNGELKAFREEKGIREAGKVKARLFPNPTLDFEAATGSMTGSSGENSISIGVSQEFILAGKRGKRLFVAESELDIYRWQLANRERLLREEVKSAFYDTLLAKERVVLADRSIALNRQLLEVAGERLAAGDIPELELNLVKVELARSQGYRIEVAKGMLQSQARLWTLMGLSPGDQPAITGTLVSDIPMAKTLAELKQLTNSNRPDLKAFQVETGRGEAEISLAQSEGIPNLTAGLVFRRDATTMEINGAEGRDTAYTVGIKLSIPIPVFDRNQAGVQEARARKMSSESRLNAAGRTVELEVETAYAGLQNAVSVLALYRRDIIPQLEENLKLTQEAYRLGEVGVLAIIQEQKKFFEVSDGYLSALHAGQIALTKLEAAVGVSLE